VSKVGAIFAFFRIWLQWQHPKAPLKCVQHKWIQWPKTYPLNTNSEGSLHRTEVITEFIAILVYFCLHLIAMATPFAPW